MPASLVVSLMLAGMRIAGMTHPAFQAAAHVWVGLLLGVAWLAHSYARRLDVMLSLLDGGHEINSPSAKSLEAIMDLHDLSENAAASAFGQAVVLSVIEVVVAVVTRL